jgi:hypothetical protein
MKIKMMLKYIFFLISFMLILCCNKKENQNGGDASSAQLNLTGSMLGNSGMFIDVDGDRLPDKVMGAPYASYGSATGVALVYKGVGSGYSSTYTMILSGDDNFGFSMVNAGDVDGDGTEDFAISAIHGSGEGTNDASLAGAVYVYKGGTNGLLIKKLGGENPLDKFGYAIAAGDLNNDGYSDIIVGAPYNTKNPANYQNGAVYVFFGPDLNTRVALYYASTFSGLGWSVAAGDINGDGIADLLISTTGKTLAFYGVVPGSQFVPDLNSPNVVIIGIDNSFGKSIAVVGDINGDKYSEIAIGSPAEKVNNIKNIGTVYVFKGGTGNRTITVRKTTPPIDQLTYMEGESSSIFSAFGTAISIVGDVDNDSIPDFMVSSPYTDNVTNDLAGKLYLYLGKELTQSFTNYTVWSYYGQSGSQRFGAFLTYKKIMGNNRLLIGAPGLYENDGGTARLDVSTSYYGLPVTCH